MAVAPHGIPEGIGELWATRSTAASARATLIAVVVALGVHGAVGAALSTLDIAELFRRERNIEVEVNEPPPPPPDVKPEPPPPPPPPPEARPRIVMHKAPLLPPPEAPPPPNQEPPPKASEAPPVFGVTMDSVVSGDGAGMAVPVGNTLMTKDRSRPKAGPAQPMAGDTTKPPEPVPDIFLAERPRVLEEIKADYPADAHRMGIEGVVDLKVTIGPKGEVLDVKVLKAAGHGFDEAARAALKKFKFSPPRTSDGKGVVTNIPYKYRFELPPQ